MPMTKKKVTSRKSLAAVRSASRKRCAAVAVSSVGVSSVASESELGSEAMVRADRREAEAFGSTLGWRMESGRSF